MGRQLYLRQGLGTITDITHPTITPLYKLGEIIPIEEDDGTLSDYIYIKAVTALTQFQPYVLDYSVVVNSTYTNKSPVTQLEPIEKVIIPQDAFLIDQFGFVLLKGNGKALLIAESYASGDFLEILNTATALNVGNPFSASSTAMSRETGTTAEARDIFLLGLTTIVPAT